MIEGCLRQADGRSVAELERLRDDFLAELLVLVERYAVAPSAAAPAIADVILDTPLQASLRSA